MPSATPQTPTSTSTPESQTVETEHYKLYVERLDAPEVGRLLESAYVDFAAFFGSEPSGPLEGEIYRDASAYVAALERDGLEYPGGGGYYSPATRKFYLYVQPSEYYTRQLIIHEALHQFHYLVATGNRGASAGWFAEGLAEYFGMHNWDGESLLTRTIPAISLEDYPDQASRQLEEADVDGLSAYVLSTMAAPRPLSWALVGYLVDTQPAKFEDLSTRLNRRDDPATAWRDVFGEPDQTLNDGLAEWLAGHQQPWREVWRAWQEVGELLEGKSSVNGIAVLKKAPASMAVEMELVDGDPLGGIVVGFRSASDFVLFQATSTTDVRVVQFLSGQWTTLARGQVQSNGGLPNLEAVREPDTDIVTLIANGMEIHSRQVPGQLGLNVDGAHMLFRVTLEE